jgi:adenosylcobinamide-phosphate synthase
MFASLMALAMLIDAALGWPRVIFDRMGHPVTWIGRLIAAMESGFNTGHDILQRRRAGMIATLIVVGVSAGVALAVQSMLPGGWPGLILAAILAWPFLATRSLHDHVAAVVLPLATGDLSGARLAVSAIVGRDPAQLDQAGVARAAMESLAENTSDGVVAPLFWGLVFGLPGLVAYKAINTLDSMIGHRTERHEHFGWFAARLDDWVNLIPARLTGFLFALVSGRFGEAFAIMRRDARHHRSPNAGWPEAAMAGALGVRLSGPRAYADRIAPEPWINGSAPDPTPADLDRGLSLYLRAMIALWLALVVLAWM